MAAANGREPVHLLGFGESGAGKSTLAATFPKPMLVIMWDPIGKDTPYLRRGVASPRRVDEFGIPFREVRSTKNPDRVLIRIEYYHDPDPKAPDAYNRFLQRVNRLDAEIEAGLWQTLVFDSVTFAELAVRKWNQYILNPHTKESRQWYGASKEALEEMLLIRFGALYCNVVVLAHIDEDKDEMNGVIVRNPSAPGKLRKSLGSAYGEVWRAYITRKDGEPQYLLQTRGDDRFNCSTQVGAPDPAPPDYRLIMAVVSAENTPPTTQEA